MRYVIQGGNERHSSIGRGNRGPPSLVPACLPPSRAGSLALWLLSRSLLAQPPAYKFAGGAGSCPSEQHLLWQPRQERSRSVEAAAAPPGLAGARLWRREPGPVPALAGVGTGM